MDSIRVDDCSEKRNEQDFQSKQRDKYDLHQFYEQYHGLLEYPDVQLPFDAKYRLGGYY